MDSKAERTLTLAGKSLMLKSTSQLLDANTLHARLNELLVVRSLSTRCKAFVVVMGNSSTYYERSMTRPYEFTAIC